jgi:hypothetical protein
MARVSPFHSIDEPRKSPMFRVYHNNDACSLGRALYGWQRVDGDGGHRLCKECDDLNRKEPPRRWI